MLKLSIRDIFAAMTLSAVCTAWWLDRSEARSAIEAMRGTVEQAKLDVAASRAKEKRAAARNVHVEAALDRAKRLLEAGECIEIVYGLGPYPIVQSANDPDPLPVDLDFAFVKGSYEDEVKQRSNPAPAVGSN